MGVWSEPLLTHCVDAAGRPIPSEHVRLTFSSEEVRSPPPWLQKLCNHGMFAALQLDALSVTLQEGCMSASHTAKVWGYVDGAEIAAWETLFARVRQQNATVVEIQVHWWCSDIAKPYAIVTAGSFSRGSALRRALAQCEDGVKLCVLMGREDHALYTVVAHSALCDTVAAAPAVTTGSSSSRPSTATTVVSDALEDAESDEDTDEDGDESAQLVEFSASAYAHALLHHPRAFWGAFRLTGIGRPPDRQRVHLADLIRDGHLRVIEVE
jgi:hypothetical protein